MRTDIYVHWSGGGIYGQDFLGGGCCCSVYVRQRGRELLGVCMCACSGRVKK